jgi:Ankyrin repeats (3 copies)
MERGFLTDRDSAPWKTWRPSRDTLIVIDYVFQFADIIRQIVKAGTSKETHKIRLVILDHIFPAFLNDLPSDPFLQPLAENRKELDARKRLFHSASPMLLSSAPNRSEILADVIAHVSGEARESAAIRHALKDLQAMGDAACHPLFAALMGDAIRQRRDTCAWARSDLIAYYLESTNRLPWLNKQGASAEDSVQNGFCVGAFVAAATANRGLRFRSLIENTSNLIGKTDENLRRIIARCLRIVSDSSCIDISTSLPPFKPDIIGGAFFIRFCKEFFEDEARREFFINLLEIRESGPAIFRIYEDRLEELSTFTSFLRNLSSQLASDKQPDTAVRSSWLVLLNFLNPANFAQYPKTQYAVRAALPRVAINALRAGRGDIAERLFGYENPQIDHPLPLGEATHLMEAAYVGNLLAVKGLVRAGASVEKATSEGDTPLFFACRAGHLEVVQFLVEECNANVNRARQVDGVTSLMVAALNNHIATVDYLLGVEGIIVDAPTNEMKETALLAASSQGHFEVVKLLLHAGADPNRATCHGITPLAIACSGGFTRTASILLANGADPNPAAVEGKTPLMLAIARKKRRLVTLLLSQGATL